MANQLYGKGKEKFARGQVNLVADTIRAYLVSDGYVLNAATHEFVSDLGANILNTPQVLAGKSDTLGVFDANDVSFAAVTAGANAKAVILVKWVTVAGDSPLLAYIDTLTGFPRATAGVDIPIQWDNGTYKIFSF